jgi:hypothetical protein
LKWEIAIPGGGDPGVVLPFLISDKTPRERRISPTPTAVESELTGIERVIIAVDELNQVVERFRRAFPILPDTTAQTSGLLEAEIVRFSGMPPVLARPADNSWLAERLLRFGVSPCGFLLGTTDFERSMRRLELDVQAVWGEQRVGLSTDSTRPLFGVGVIEVHEGCDH